MQILCFVSPLGDERFRAAQPVGSRSFQGGLTDANKADNTVLHSTTNRTPVPALYICQEIHISSFYCKTKSKGLNLTQTTAIVCRAPVHSFTQPRPSTGTRNKVQRACAVSVQLRRLNSLFKPAQLNLFLHVAFSQPLTRW